jgi:DNA-binding transcriptional LysR family regulator
VELRHLRYFVAAAEEENFGRAARRLNLTEPALGFQIKNLERELGVRLFERLPRGVRLTAVGAAFLVDARHMLGFIVEAAERARRVGRGEEGCLRVGHVPDAPLRGSSGEIIGRLIAAVRVRQPRLDVRTVQSTPLLFLPRSAHPALYDSVLRELRARGLEPQLADERFMTDLTTGVSMVGAGAGWLPMMASVGEMLAQANGGGFPGVVYRRWADPPIPFLLQLLWRDGERSALVARFIAVAREFRNLATIPADAFSGGKTY